ncbi:MAG: PAS domain-containing protein [Promethearchaeota archaeon]
MIRKYTSDLDEFLSTTLKCIVDAVITVDIFCRINYMNPAAEILTDWEKNNAIGKPLEEIFNIIDEETRKKFENLISKVLKDEIKNYTSKNIILLTKKGKEIPINFNATLIKNEVGTIMGAVLIFRDITNEKKAEEALRRSKTSLADAQRIARIGNWEWEILKNELYWSDEIYRIFNIPPQEFGKTYKAFLGLVHPDDRDLVKNAVESALYEKKPYRIDHRIVLPDGLVRIVHEEAEVTYNENNKPIRMVGTVQDITEYKEMEQKLKQSEKKYIEAYKRADFYKDLFAHDISNILQIILTGIELSESFLDQQTKASILKDNFQLIKEQIFRGKHLVSNVRKFSLLENDEIPLKNVEICNILKKSIISAKAFRPNREYDIKVESISEEVMVRANDLLEDVFENILINAIKHNRNPQIEIKIRISKETRNNINYVKMEFIDNGLGVNDDRKSNIFLRKISHNHKHYGMGLGLSLVKMIIENYHASVWVEDKIKGDYSQGSNFILMIPEGKQILTEYLLG